MSSEKPKPQPSPRALENALEHDACRGMVYIMCFKKPIPNSSGRLILKDSVYANRLRQFWFSNYDPTDQRLPNGICAAHRNLLLDFEKKTKENEQNKVKQIPLIPLPELPPPIDFSELKFPTIPTHRKWTINAFNFFEIWKST